MTTKSESRGLILLGLDRHPKVRAYDNEGMEPGRFMLTLSKGWAFDGAVTERGGDSRGTSHCGSFSSTKAALAALKWTDPCCCDSCTVDTTI